VCGVVNMYMYITYARIATDARWRVVAVH